MWLKSIPTKHATVLIIPETNNHNIDFCTFDNNSKLTNLLMEKL